MDLNSILAKAMQVGASDIHLKHGVMPVFRIHGKLLPIDKNAKRLTADEILEMAYQIMSPQHRKRFEETHEVDMGYGVAGLGRFRINIFQQRGSAGMVIRAIPYQIKSLDELHMPTVVKKITAFERGLVLVTGITGCGKSTTLASMLDFINNTRNTHILTIEDPIEYLIRDKRSIVNQRELGLDTPGFSYALRQALRQDPDVIFIGEMRDTETIRTALIAAETGHLVLSTLHTADAAETINRILVAFEPHQQNQIRNQLAANLKAVISQRLVPRADGKGVVPACEVMIVNTRIKEMIIEPKKTREIPQAIEDGVQTLEMQTFDQSLMALLRSKQITLEEAKAAATNPDDFTLRYKGVVGVDNRKWQDFDSKKTDPTMIPTLPRLEIETLPDYDDDEED